MNIKVYLAGILSIIASLLIIILGASLMDTNAASENEQQSESIASDNSNTGLISNLTDNEASDSSLTTYTDVETINTEYSDLMDSYNDLVKKYNDIVIACQEASLDKNEDIKDVVENAAEVITELGKTDLNTASEEEIQDITESIELMNELLDKINDGIKVYESSDTELVVNYEKPDFSVTTTSGEEFTLSQQGGNIVVVSFFATWCNPCKEEMHSLQKLRNKYNDKGVKIISICCGEDNSATDKFMQDNSLTYLAAGDSDGAISTSYNVGAIPYTIVFDKTGAVLAEFEGLYDYSDYEKCIESAL